ncbi:hypothetical protein L596_001930 [Steinernema carpocapsae]|uniref:Uncharacterized protein n=1 Tax=Steinernema carpocapsae TaxID=34508 RepID=A0A4U8UMN0_STECR|nr:hypothetical protein L596_001930 [Steinernema carpocapsae]
MKPGTTVTVYHIFTRLIYCLVNPDNLLSQLKFSDGTTDMGGTRSKLKLGGVNRPQVDHEKKEPVNADKVPWMKSKKMVARIIDYLRSEDSVGMYCLKN